MHPEIIKAASAGFLLTAQILSCVCVSVCVCVCVRARSCFASRVQRQVFSSDTRPGVVLLFIFQTRAVFIKYRCFKILKDKITISPEFSLPPTEPVVSLETCLPREPSARTYLILNQYQAGKHREAVHAQSSCSNMTKQTHEHSVGSCILCACTR